MGNITKGPGTYAIFEKNNKKKNKCGKCLYIGQSVDVKARINEHKYNIKIATNIINGDMSKINIKAMYYHLSKVEQDKGLVFKKLYYMSFDSFNKLNNISKAFGFIMLSILEQKAIDIFKPKLNVIWADRSDLPYYKIKEKEV